MQRNIMIAIGAVILVALIIGGVLFLNNRNNSPTSTTNTTTSDTITNPPPVAAAPNAVAQSKDACTVVTAAMIKTDLGLDVGTGVGTITTYTNGSTCLYKTADNSSAIITAQVFPESTGTYLPSIWTGITELTDVGDKAFVQTPSSGNSNAQAVKGTQQVYLNIYSNSSYSFDQVKALLKDSVSNL